MIEATKLPQRAGEIELATKSFGDLQKARYDKETKAWFSRKESELRLRERSVYLMLSLFALGLVSTFVIIFFEGFHVGGFDLPDEFLHWLGGATVGEVAGLLVITFRYLFPKQEE